MTRSDSDKQHQGKKGQQRQSGKALNPMDALYEEVSPVLRQAILCCALPHLFDRSLALALIHVYLEASEEAELLLNNLLELPFVYPHNKDSWQFTSAARVYLIRKIEGRRADYTMLSRFLKERFQKEWENLKNLQKTLPTTDQELIEEVNWKLRQIQWQIAYHWAPLSAEEAMKRLVEISEWASTRPQYLGDHKIAVYVWRTHERLFREFRPEGVYLEGRYAYSHGNWEEAEEKLDYVWHFSRRNPLVTASAGHLLGVIWRKKGDQDSIISAEKILRECLKICDQQIENRNSQAIDYAARITNTLGATLVQLGSREKIQESLSLLRRSLDLHQQSGNIYGIPQVLNTFGTALVRLGDETRLTEAEQLFREALEVSQDSTYVRTASMLRSSLANLLIQLGGKLRFAEAEELLRQSLEYAEQHHDYRHEAHVLYRLAFLLVSMGDPERYREAENLIRRRLTLQQTFSHRKSERDSVTLLVDVLERTGQTEEAKRLREELSKSSS